MFDKPKALVDNILTDADLDSAKIQKDSGGAAIYLADSINGNLTDFDTQGPDDTFYITASFDNAKTIDAVLLVLKDAKSSLASMDVRYGSSYSSMTTAKTISEFSADRIFVSLDSPVTATHFKLNFSFNTDPQTQNFLLYQIVLGSAITFPHRPTRPYSKYKLHSEHSEQVTHSGVRVRSVFYSGRAEIEHAFVFANDSEAQAYKDLYKQTRYFEEPFWWVEEPDSEPSAARYVFADPTFSTTYTGPTLQEAKLTMIEQGPRFLAHEV